MVRSTPKQEGIKESDTVENIFDETSSYIKALDNSLFYLEEQGAKQYGIYYIPSKAERAGETGDVVGEWDAAARWRKKHNLNLTPKLYDKIDILREKLKTKPTTTTIRKTEELLKKYLIPTFNYIGNPSWKYSSYRTRARDYDLGQNPYYPRPNYRVPFEERYDFKEGKGKSQLETEGREQEERQWPMGTFPQLNIIPRVQHQKKKSKYRSGKLKKKYARGGGIRKPKV